MFGVNILKDSHFNLTLEWVRFFGFFIFANALMLCVDAMLRSFCSLASQFIGAL